MPLCAGGSYTFALLSNIKKSMPQHKQVHVKAPLRRIGKSRWLTSLASADAVILPEGMQTVQSEVEVKAQFKQ
jgi:hypothetical protein